MKKKLENKKAWICKVSVLAFLLVAMLISFFFSDKIESALGIGKRETGSNFVSASELSDSALKVNYIDVGQGSSAFIELPDGKSMLVDGGNTEYGDDVASFLSSKNVQTIDYLVATHADSDHIGGLNYVLQNFEFKHIYRPFQISGTGDSASAFQPNPDEELGGVFDLLKSQDIAVNRVTSGVYKSFITNIYSETYGEDNVPSDITVFYDGLEISGENYKFTFYAPLILDGYDVERNHIENLLGAGARTDGRVTKGYGQSDSNGNSAIFLLESLGKKFLFTGDAPYTKKGAAESNTKFEEMEFYLSLTQTEKAQLTDIDIYLVGHHGSSYSSSQQLLSLISPKFTVISCGKDNSYGHPAQDLLERIGATMRLEADYLLRTDEIGSITFGLVNGSLKYTAKQSAKTNSLNFVSWEVIAISTYVVLCIVVLSIRPSRKKSRKKN